MTQNKRLGAWADATGTRFAVWSDRNSDVSIRWYNVHSGAQADLPLVPGEDEPHCFEGFVPGLPPGSAYEVFVGGARAVDPYARSLPQGVHGAAEVAASLRQRVAPKRRIDLDAGEVLYELHIGTFTEQGTFASAAERFPDLIELGVTVIEVMPVAAFAGSHGWGYDGVALFAPFARYGTLQDLSSFVDAAHAAGLSVVLDVVYNHLGPDGNYLGVFSDNYFHHERHNPWGRAPDLEKRAFRQLVLENARYWLEDLGLDGLRIDAAHELEPGGEPHILLELAEIAQNCSPPAVLIAEDDRNDPGALLAFGLDAVWSDDFHHAVHVLLTGERDGYYGSYAGDAHELIRVIEQGQLYEGQVFPTSGRTRGKPSAAVPRSRFIYALQNHDQVGNRARGERLHRLCDPERLHAATLLWLFLPATPMFFMGQEWAAEAPFLYFADHAGELGAAVTAGRRAEFAHFSAFTREASELPDPQALETFASSKLPWQARSAFSAATFELHRQALKLRRDDEALRGPRQLRAGRTGNLLWVSSQHAEGQRLLLLNFADEHASVATIADVQPGAASLLLSSVPQVHDGQSFQLHARSGVIFSIET